MIERYPILNIWVDSVDIEQVLASIVEFIEQGDRPHTIFASNPEKNFCTCSEGSQVFNLEPPISGLFLYL